MNERCSKCGAPMDPIPKPKGNSPIDKLKFTLTGFLCRKCGEWNNIAKRKERNERAN